MTQPTREPRPTRVQAAPENLTNLFATDCACVVKYFPESRKHSIYFCPLHAQAAAMRTALADCVSLLEQFTGMVTARIDEARAVLRVIEGA